MDKFVDSLDDDQFSDFEGLSFDNNNSIDEIEEEEVVMVNENNGTSEVVESTEQTVSGGRRGRPALSAEEKAKREALKPASTGKRGRPAGAKNKPKSETLSETLNTQS